MGSDNISYPDDNCLGEIGIDDFLNQYWQKKPLLIRNAFPNMQSPLSADELAGLACEEHVNSRIVLAGSDSSAEVSENWQVEFGPFDEARFASLPDTNWSLLVSDVERHIPETKSLLSSFRFIPDWRIDDLMISYAPAGGSVGAHTDAYDVFLIQLNGQRLWKISEHFDKETLSDIDLCILKNFDAEQEWTLNAGDMLYLPPNVAHHGIAQPSHDDQGDEIHCMTASVGFRAPSVSTITSDYIHFKNEARNDDSRYRDISPTKPDHHAEISDKTVDNFVDYLRNELTIDHDEVKQWLGKFCSDNKAFEELTEKQLNVDFAEICQIASQSELIQSPYSNFLFSHSATASHLFVDGNCYEVSQIFAVTLCEDSTINFKRLIETISTSEKIILTRLFNDGSIIAA
jgi:50S ribosomal protein L16 3-hydroxylase